jgi:PTH1 family peptidyl-tRNA hydrolase
LDLYNKKVILAVPLTFMNLSGSAVKGLMNRYHLDAADILVICDDMDLPFGKIRIRPKGSSGGHRGIKSVIEDIRTKDFSRLRIGVGRPDNRMEAAEYVLSNFNKKEAPSLKKILLTAVECCEMWVNKGVVEAMNNFNAKEQGNE